MGDGRCMVHAVEAVFGVQAYPSTDDEGKAVGLPDIACRLQLMVQTLKWKKLKMI